MDSVDFLRKSVDFFRPAINLLIFSIMGIIVAAQYVHTVESQTNKTRSSWVRYIISLILIFSLVWVNKEIGGFEEKHWIFSVTTIICTVLSLIITVKILFKKKNLSFSNSQRNP